MASASISRNDPVNRFIPHGFGGMMPPEITIQDVREVSDEVAAKEIRDSRSKDPSISIAELAERTRLDFDQIERIIAEITSKEQFEREYAQRSNMSIDELQTHGLHAEPCDCGDDRCQGWQMVSRPAKNGVCD